MGQRHQATGSPWGQSYLYDAPKRLTNITLAAGSFGYDPVRSLKVATLALPNSAYISSTFDSVSRLTGTYQDAKGRRRTFHRLLPPSRPFLGFFVVNILYRWERQVGLLRKNGQ